MPTADEAVITGDRALRVWEIERLHLGRFSTFVERQMKMRAGVVEGAVAVGSANDDDIVILEIRIRRSWGEARPQEMRGPTSCRHDGWFRGVAWRSVQRRIRA